MPSEAEARERLRPFVARADAFSGWLPDTRKRVLGPGEPWDYLGRAAALMISARSVLDMGTGGGERFAGLCASVGELDEPHLSGKRDEPSRSTGFAVATEEWHVNAPLAWRRLAPLGVEVVRARSVQLPFRDGCFELVLNRHEELDPDEVARVLRPGGRVLTQQVWWRGNELSRFFPRRTDHGDHFGVYQRGFQAAGLEIVDAREHRGPVCYESLGEYVYMLCIAPWEVPDFDPLGADLAALLAMERALTTVDGVVLTEGSYVIEALKPLALPA